MAKLVNYRCDTCQKNYEELFYEHEDQPDELEEACECGGKFVKFNFKNNLHVWHNNPFG
jgi:DNA-directed RNA polymerase subunit RPC12/RpoP